MCRNRSRTPGVLVILVGCLGGLPADATAQDPWEIKPLGPGLYVSVVSDTTSYSQYANSLIVVGDEAVLVVDSRDTEEAARLLLAEIRQITDKPVRYLINTHWHWDHVNGNAVFQDAFPDVEIVAHPETARLIEEQGPERIHAEIDRLEARAERLEGYRTAGETDSGRKLTADDYQQIDGIQQADRARIEALAGVRLAVPTTLIRQPWQAAGLGRDVHILDVAPAHTLGDLVVWVPDAGVLFMGDLIEHGLPFPGDGEVLGHAKSLNELAELGAGFYLPAHGPAVSNEPLFEGQRAFWNKLDLALRNPVPDSTGLAELVDRLVAEVDPVAFPGAISPGGEATARFRQWVEEAVRQGSEEREVAEPVGSPQDETG